MKNFNAHSIILVARWDNDSDGVIYTRILKVKIYNLTLSYFAKKHWYCPYT